MAEKKVTLASQVEHLALVALQGASTLFFFCHSAQVLLVWLGIAAYWADVGFDADGMIRWLTMAGCYR